MFDPRSDLSALFLNMAGFAWDQPAVFWGAKITTRSDVLLLSQDASSTYILLATTNSGTTVPRRAASKLSTDTINLTSPSRVPTDVTDHSYWFRGRDSLDYYLCTHSIARCTGNARRRQFIVRG